MRMRLGASLAVALVGLLGSLQSAQASVGGAATYSEPTARTGAITV